jgi:Flp pilus assembly pilin Flp
MFVRIAAEERGASAAEYAVLLMLLLVGTVAAGIYLAASIGSSINGTANSMNAPRLAGIV